MQLPATGRHDDAEYAVARLYDDYRTSMYKMLGTGKEGELTMQFAVAS